MSTQQIVRAIARPIVSAIGRGSDSFVSSLYSGGELGAWFDASDLSTLFQDTAGTVPVTADGQSVALWRDKSGRANHVTQATAGSRPTFRTSGGLCWLEFDGTADFMTSTTGGGFTAQEAIAAVMPTGGAGTSRDWLNDTGTGDPLRAGISSGGNYFGITPGAPIAGNVGATLNVAVVHGVSNNGSQSICYVNGVAGTPSTVTGGVAPAAGFAVGAAEGGAAQRWVGRIYGIVWRQNAFSELQRNEIYRYLAAKAGIPA